MKVLNDLYDYGLKIYQDTEKFKFSLDSLLLAEFVELKKDDINILSHYFIFAMFFYYVLLLLSLCIICFLYE